MYAVSLRPTFPALAGFTLVFAAYAILFGGNFPFAQGLLPLFCACFTVLSLAVPLRLPALGTNKLLLAGIALPILGAFLEMALQILPLTPGAAYISPFWSLIPHASATISVAPTSGYAAIPVAIGYVLAAVALFRIGQQRPASLALIVSVTITVCAFYGIIAFAGGNGRVLWLPKTSYFDSLTATFINRNSFATFAGLGMLTNLALGLQRVGEISQRLDTRQRLRAFILLVLKPGWPFMLAAVVCFIALVLTNSRAGLTASIAGVLVLLSSLAYMRPPVRIPLAAIMGSILVLSLIVLSAIGGTLGNRLGSVGTDASIRQSIYSATGTLIGQYRTTGTGFGTYADAIPTARTPLILGSLPALIDHAHNTYLELTAELGLPGIILFAISAFCLIVACLTGLRTRRRAIVWPALGLSTIVLVGGHALADFSLSIPAVTLATLAILMLALAQSLPPAEKDATTLIHRSKPAILGFVIVSAALLAVSGWQTAANYHAFKSDSTLRAVLNAKPAPLADLFVAQQHLQRCLDINPWHATCAFNLAHTELALANIYGLTGPNAGVALVYLNMAQAQYQQALTLAPANPLAWYRLARISAFIGEPTQAVTYLANSILTGPSEPFIAQQRIPLMLSLLSQADAENTRLFTDNLQAIWLARPWSVAAEVLANTSIQQQFANATATMPGGPQRWERYIKTPFPTATARPGASQPGLANQP